MQSEPHKTDLIDHLNFSLYTSTKWDSQHFMYNIKLATLT